MCKNLDISDCKPNRLNDLLVKLAIASAKTLCDMLRENTMKLLIVASVLCLAACQQIGYPPNTSLATVIQSLSVKYSRHSELMTLYEQVTTTY